MENLTTAIDQAVDRKDYTTLKSIFSNVDGQQQQQYQGKSSSVVQWQSVGPGEQRSVSAYFLTKIVTTQGFLDNLFTNEQQQQQQSSLVLMIPVLTTALGHLPSIVDGAADNVVREALFQYYVSEEEYVSAARILSTMRMEDGNPGTGTSAATDSTSGGSSDSNSNNNNNNTEGMSNAVGVYYTTPARKTDIYVKIAECFLAADEASEADAAVNRAGIVIEQIGNKEQHAPLILRYKSTYARVLDCNRKFLQASMRYYELSQSTYIDIIDADDLIQMLGRAVTCIILASSTSPQRTRVLNSIAKDPRIQQLNQLSEFALHATILHKMYTNQIITKAEVTEFESNLAEHQNAVRGDGMTIMERSVLEHNMIAVSTLYESIYLTELAFVLGTSTPKKAERIAATMITDGTLNGFIDQVDGILQFHTDFTIPPPTSSSSSNNNNNNNPSSTYSEAWDQSVTSFFTQLNEVTDAIKAI